MSRLTAFGSGVRQMAGFGLGMLALALATLAAIPTMVSVSGSIAWAGIATGQAVGSIGAVVVAYGWIISGPAAISRADADGRRLEYLESLRTRLVICVPVTIACAGVAALLVHDDHVLAGLGAASTAVIGLTASWYYVGTLQPFRLFIFETLPRVAGTTLGILLMHMFHTAAAGLISQLAGTVSGLMFCSVAILRRRPGSCKPAKPPRPVIVVLREERYGVTSSAVSTVYGAAPIALVGLIAPGALPPYAVVDKIQKQLTAALSPFVQVLQSWVPRAEPAALRTRAKTALVLSFSFGLALTLAIMLIGRPLTNWLGGGEIAVGTSSIFFTALLIALNVIDSVVGNAGLVPLGMVSRVATITFYGSVVGIIAAMVGVWRWGVDGALVGLILGLVLRISWGCFTLRSDIQHTDSSTRRGTVSPETPAADEAELDQPQLAALPPTHLQ